MADDYAIFKNDRRPVHFAFLEGKVSCPHPACEKDAVFLQKNGLQQHYKIRHPEARVLPKIEEAAFVRMKNLHGKETRNLLQNLFESRSRQVLNTYL